ASALVGTDMLLHRWSHMRRRLRQLSLIRRLAPGLATAGWMVIGISPDLVAYGTRAIGLHRPTVDPTGTNDVTTGTDITNTATGATTEIATTDTATGTVMEIALPETAGTVAMSIGTTATTTAAIDRKVSSSTRERRSDSLRLFLSLFSCDLLSEF